MSEFPWKEGAWRVPGCEHEVNGVKCGRSATCIIELDRGRARQQNPLGEIIGYGTGSSWKPICDIHRECYPDFDGVEIAKTSVS